jgi:pilus assembly protein CpaF
MAAESEPLDERLHRRLLATLDLGQTVDDARLTDLVRHEGPLLSQPAVADVVARLRARIDGLGDIQPLLADPDISDVLVNGPGPVWVERRGALVRTEVALNLRAVELLVERIVSPLGLRADRTTPIVDARLPDGSRAHVVQPPLAVDGPVVTIRRFAATTLPLWRFCDAPTGELLAWAVDAGLNLVVCGGTGAGKTTLLNTLCQLLPGGQRVVTVEDAAELRLPGDHVVRLETRPATPDGLAAVTMRELVRAALRMRPDRIVVGEVRGGEALDMVQALNTGHDGSLSTCHANGPLDALRRLETLCLMAGTDLPLAAVREQIAGAVDLLVHVARRPDGARAVVGAAEVAESSDDPVRARTLVRNGLMVAEPRRTPRRPVATNPTITAPHDVAPHRLGQQATGATS